ncbi:ABC transporter substrate-binding protein [Cohnella candidum]|uniref:ABC transporter substrate-binding protein n=1 Tax=Cohnella candidum TaxID=2674991 RepID=A0A3G3K3S6_9BACL|nr:ABC transporter substrate-binding protein [Cohnella candidum]AYQ75174.1 ABC transporter substrate-binding protein [Cohnella candidum]
MTILKKTNLGFLVLLLMLTMALAACGKKGETAGAATPSSPASASQSSGTSGELKKLVIAEPIHSVGYLPLYVAQKEGYFEKRGLQVEVITATGGAHVTSVVSGDAWGVIGGPESNAMANRKNKDPIVSVVNVVNRANVYLMAKKGLAPKSNSKEDLKEFLKGKKISASRHGGTPNLLTRYLLIELGLDPEKDVTLEEPADGSTVVSMVQKGIVDLANGAEPQITDGISKGVWDEPFYKFPDMGDYSYSVLSVRKSSIDEDPATVQAFVDAIIEGLNKVNGDKEYAKSAVKAEFPTLSDESVQASLDRAYEDNLWSKDGLISESALKLDMDVMLKTGIFTDPYKYDELVDMQFVKNSK